MVDVQIPTRERIEHAAQLIERYVRRTPVLRLDLPSRGAITLKLEQLQHTGSFKPRGAFTNVLTTATTPATLVAASGGNHGLAVAYAGRRLGIPTQVFVPQTAPAAKVSRLRAWGADVRQHGQRYADAYEASLSAAAQPGALAVHAYDSPATVTGQATMAREISEQVPEVSSLVVAVGGGGLMGGACAWFGESTQLVAAEPVGSASYAAAYDAGGPVDITPRGLASDSLGASRIGEIAWAAMRAARARPVVVDDATVLTARELLWRECRIAAELGGVVALAAVLEGQVEVAPDGGTVVVVCGANADPSDLPMN
ncbi:serine/threonine dehydratase [Blastococcus sp. Marseille-P5729]|uniref:serine/threonine dehydratase n=1 Tax=Blastococcus sp. Marseille-P5729 TaxID=2086582 RepID=UPI000D104828|nr:serine/threonine dehydratase [Blastococcus sp. Marseille-P5729]